MSKEQFKGFYTLWIFFVIVELVWLYAVTSSVVIVGRVIFIITLIACTLVIGALGIHFISRNSKQ